MPRSRFKTNRLSRVERLVKALGLLFVGICVTLASRRLLERATAATGGFFTNTDLLDGQEPVAVKGSNSALAVVKTQAADGKLAVQLKTFSRRGTVAAAAADRQDAEAGPVTGAQRARRLGTYLDSVNGKQVERDLLDEPIPSDCHAEANSDYAGPALTWGLTYKKRSAAACCQACKEFKPTADGRRCNVWVFCPDPSGVCWSADIWNHTSGECWLKFQKKWDKKTDRRSTNLVVNSRGKYPPQFRKEHKTAPPLIPWISGVVLQ